MCLLAISHLQARWPDNPELEHELRNILKDQQEDIQEALLEVIAAMHSSDACPE